MMPSSVPQSSAESRAASGLRGSQRWLLLALALLLLVGVAIRLYDLTDPPLDFHPVRQLRSAMIARGMYYRTLDDVEPWRQQMAVRQAEGLETLEPPILEWLTAQSYRLIGSEQVWVARVVSSLAWVAGAVALYGLARRYAGAGALFSLAYMLLLPFAVQASRSFQPDPLMVALTMAALNFLDRWFREDSPGWGSTLLAGTLGGLAVLVKLPAVFFLAGAFLGLALAQNRLLGLMRYGKAWVMATLFMVPAGLYYGSLSLVGGAGGGETWRFFVTSLLTSPRFYLDWLAFILRLVGYTAFVGALTSLILLDRRGRGLVAGLLGGYVFYGLTFTYHIATHDYYSLPLIPVLALGLAAPGQALLDRFRAVVREKRMLQVLAAGVALLAVLLPLRTARGILAGHDFRAEVGYWKALGNTLENRSDLMAISHDYGYRLEYYGWVQTSAWMTAEDLELREILGQSGSEDSIEVVAEQLEGRSLFVVTILSDLDKLPVLKRYLETRPVFAQGDDYIVYDLRVVEGE